MQIPGTPRRPKGSEPKPAMTPEVLPGQMRELESRMRTAFIESCSKRRRGEAYHPQQVAGVQMAAEILAKTVCLAFGVLPKGTHEMKELVEALRSPRRTGAPLLPAGRAGRYADELSKLNGEVRRGGRQHKAGYTFQHPVETGEATDQRLVETVRIARIFFAELGCTTPGLRDQVREGLGLAKEEAALLEARPGYDRLPAKLREAAQDWGGALEHTEGQWRSHDCGSRAGTTPSPS